MPERLRHHVADALLVGVRVLAQDGQHSRHVRPEVLAQGEVARPPLRHADGDDLPQRGQQQVLRLLALGRRSSRLSVVDDDLEQSAHGTDGGVAERQRRGEPHLVLRVLELLEQRLAEARGPGEVGVLAALTQGEQRELALLRGLRLHNRAALLDFAEEALNRLLLHVCSRCNDNSRKALGQRRNNLALRLGLSSGDARGVRKLRAKPLEGAVLAVLRNSGQKVQDRLQSAALQQRRPANDEHRGHALLHDDGRQLWGGGQRLHRHLHAEVCDVQVRVRDEGNDVGQDLHRGLLRHALAVLPQHVHQGVEALLPEGPAVLAQVRGQLAADRCQRARERRDLDL
mmetsp:Transcript_30927/g.79410  ORF Transcript_30927/g.79410 Transcript_30927/m.79410 type:complete len:343 (+) Transcript_30927:964-1992(+)